jgi:indole-3-glycerol phosphate synthase
LVEGYEGTYFEVGQVWETRNGLKLRVKDFNFEILGINNRNLDTLKTDLKTSFDLAPKINKKNPGTLIVCESGIKTKNDYPSQSQALLIGESFAKNPRLLLELKG